MGGGMTLKALVRQPVLLAVCLAAAGGATAQDAPVARQQPFFETAQVNLINVEVVVIDKNGRPVIGLTSADFEVFEDGRKVEITNFYAAAPPPLPGPAGAVAPAQESAPELPPVEQRLSVVVLVDNSGITGGERKRALSHTEELLNACLQIPRTQAMIVTLDQRAHVRQEFTLDVKLLGAALKRVASEPTDPTAGAINDLLIERAMSRVSVASGTDLNETAAGLGRSGAAIQDFAREDARALLDAIRSSAEASRERTSAVMASLATFIESLAGFPGRKVIFYVGNGLSLRPGESLFLKWESRFGNANLVTGFSAPLEVSQLSLSSEFRNLVARANADRVTFYAIDARGPAGLGGPTSEQPVLDPQPGTEISEAMGKEQSILYLTTATGGTTTVSTAKASPALALVVDDLQTYYSLAYPAPRIGDGRDHSITVKVLRDGVTARYRRHYLDKTADDRVVERNLSALLHNSGSNSLEVDVSVGTPVRHDGKTFAVPLLVTVPLGKLVLLPEGDTHHASISIFLAAKDLDDRITPPVKRTFPVNIPDVKLATALGQSVRFVFEMLMTRGPQTVAVSVRDDLAEAESTVTARFSVVEQGNQVQIQQGSS